MTEQRIDVCVVGGGAAGVAAAWSVARAGASVLLIERYGFLGGMGTAAMMGTFCGLYTSGPSPRPVPAGFGWTVVRHLLSKHAAYRSRFERTFLVHYDPDVLKVTYDCLAEEAGVKVLLHSLCTQVETDDGAIEWIRVETRDEPVCVRARVYIDCSGDAELFYRAGAPVELGDKRGRVQPASAIFRMANVDLALASSVSRQQLNALMRSDFDSGTWPLARLSGSFYPTTNPNEVVVNMTRVNVNGVDPEDLSRGEREGRRQIQLYARWLCKRVSGFSNAYVSAIGVQLGLRETRRIVPHRWLTASDLRAGYCSDQDLGAGAWPFEVHDPEGTGTRLEWLPDGTIYYIPLSAVTSPCLSNALAAGRCIGASSEAHASTRVMGTCFSLGEAVGALAADCAKRPSDQLWRNGPLDKLRLFRETSVLPESMWPEVPCGVMR
jgi:hypothetical protein